MVTFYTFQKLIFVKYELKGVLEYICVSIICDAMGHAAKRKEKREKDDPSRGSNYTPAIRAVTDYLINYRYNHLPKYLIN